MQNEKIERVGKNQELSKTEIFLKIWRIQGARIRISDILKVWSC